MVQKKIPMRRCAGCMESHPQKDMIRIAWDGESLKVDQTGRARGRGVYFCRNAACIEKGRKSRGLNRSFKRNFQEEELEGVFRELLMLIKEV